MALIQVLNKDLEAQVATLLAELTGLVKDLRAEVAAIKAVRELVLRAMRES